MAYVNKLYTEMLSGCGECTQDCSWHTCANYTDCVLFHQVFYLSAGFLGEENH